MHLHSTTSVLVVMPAALWLLAFALGYPVLPLAPVAFVYAVAAVWLLAKGAGRAKIQG